MVNNSLQKMALRPEGLRSRPVRMAKVFDDPEAVLSLIRRLAPYRTMAAYFGGQGLGDAQETDVPWFLDVPEAKILTENPHWIAAAREAFDAEIVQPLHCTINLNAPAPQGQAHTDLPVFRGFAAPQAPIWLLMNMVRSGLFFSWLVPVASGLAWFWRGSGGEFQYWPDGPDAPPVCERAPLWNQGVMSDNEVMWHRVGAIGDAAGQAELAGGLCARVRMHCTAKGWEIRDDDGRAITRYAADGVRISLLWKAYVFKDEAHLASFENSDYNLDLDQVVAIYRADLAARGLSAPRSANPIDDPEWQAILDRTYLRLPL